MARVNTVLNRQTERNHEGVPAYAVSPAQQLRRSVMACLLWENEFYESGTTIAARIADLVPQVAPETVAEIAVEARTRMHLRHVPLLLVREMARHPSHRKVVRKTLASVIQRADELAEFLAIYWQGGRCKLAKSVQRGLADAFTQFSAYSLAKYNRDGAVKLRDVLFLSHAKPKNAEQAATWKQLVDGTLEAPDTWEVALSAGADKKTMWERLLAEEKLGALALLRNLRNMQTADVDDDVIRLALTRAATDRVLPFRFLAALRYAPQFAAELEGAMLRNLAEEPKLVGTTAILIDVSPSMNHRLSEKSDMTRTDAACGLAVLIREVCTSARVFAFSTSVKEVPAFRGLALADAIKRAVPSDGTLLGKAVTHLNGEQWDRLIVVTDEESQDAVPGPRQNGTLVNVASNKNGVGYGPWLHIDGWSDRVLDFVRAREAETEE
jgi:60 kDa SS-A/Ro ribonucleoprotein